MRGCGVPLTTLILHTHHCVFLLSLSLALTPFYSHRMESSTGRNCWAGVTFRPTWNRKYRVIWPPGIHLKLRKIL